MKARNISENFCTAVSACCVSNPSVSATDCYGLFPRFIKCVEHFGVGHNDCDDDNDEGSNNNKYNYKK